MLKCCAMIGNQAQGRCLLFLIISIIFLINIDEIIGEEDIAAPIGQNFSVPCSLQAENVYWKRNGRNITKSDKRFSLSKNVSSESDEENLEENTNPTHNINILNIAKVKNEDKGNYSCHSETEETYMYIQPVIAAKIIDSSSSKVYVNESDDVQMHCTVEGFPLERYKHYIKWYRHDDNKENSYLDFEVVNKTSYVPINNTVIKAILKIEKVAKKDNGTYYCTIEKPPVGEQNRIQSSVFVLEKPQVSIDFIKAVGAHKIFLNWTVMDGNAPVEKYFVQFLKKDAAIYQYYKEIIEGTNNSYVLEDFEPDTQYDIKISASNKVGIGPPYVYPFSITTLKTDPSFIPEIEAKGNTHSTVTIGWAPPPSDVLEYIQYYELVVASANDNSSVIEEAIHPQNSRNLPYMFDNLQTSTEYLFKVRACSELTKLCGNWSEIVKGTTSDGTSSEPLNVVVSCDHFNISRRNTVTVSWDPPLLPRGVIMKYQVDLRGTADYRNDKGTSKKEDMGVKSKHIEPGKEKRQKALFEGVAPNTNYTISISAITRSKRLGEYAYANCTMPATVPDAVGKLLWGKLKTEKNDWIFKLYLPRLSERNGPICCYRVYLVRVLEPNQPLEELPENLDISTYHEVHALNNTKGGAYIAEVLSSNYLQQEVFLGDGENLEKNYTLEYENSCRSCVTGIALKPFWKRKFKTTTIPSPIEIANQFPEYEEEIVDTISPNPILTSATPIDAKLSNRRRRQHSLDNSIAIEENKTPNPTSISIGSNSFEIYDGPLDAQSFYTGFVEVVVQNDNAKSNNDILSTFSEYFQMMAAGPPINPNDNDDEISAILNIVVQILCVLILIVLLLLMALCLLHRYYSKHAGQGDEVISLRDSLSRALCGGRSSHNHHRHLIGSASKPPDISPISKEELPQAYVSRHKDSDYGFQHEFEMLPDRFNDRTTKYSDAKENVYKNRYPDIKSYDQTRVKLSLVNSMLGSDYINANFVMGYKERKKFICAQGPMDSTVTDFWRMIWEQHLEIIVMLTNLEEYNKSKCAKYWPEKIGETTQFGEISVTFDDENRYSDYLVRDLKLVKRNDNSEEDDEHRTITQYHYLVWKDFMAPEHPHGIVKFIRKINSVYSLQRGPILIHCSAGVGRTGTLVALDSLTQQLQEEGQVSIFNTVCDLRHQRNFLVQSLKQYIFLYRALVDIAQFGNTEIESKDLAAAIENLKLRSNDSKEQCKLELEYQKIKTISDDTKKTSAVGSSENNQTKNRSELIIPFDRNRVILTPMTGKENSTYINASFIEGYDNSESFIITQDPMETTISDFWRMISEQSIRTIVMMSEIGDGPKKCPRYWADNEIQLDHILVKYIQSESLPYYTRREFNVINCRCNDTIQVTQFQYNGWPTVEGEVPEVTRGMIELVEKAQNHHNSEDHGAMVVHCSLGSDRSSIYVAMCILVQQLRIEKKIDVCTTIRKLRSQRNLLIDSYAQYEFLHRAIVNYYDLHRLSLDTPSDC